MQLPYTLTSEEMRRRFLPPMRFRQRLAMLGAPFLFCTAAWFGGFGKAAFWLAVAVLSAIVMALFWIAEQCLARKDSSTDYLVEISELSLSVKAADGPERRYSWAHSGNVIDEGEYFMFASARGQYLVVVPRSAFADSQAEAFFEQSRRYWETAQERQRDETHKAEGSWPPPPRIGG